MLLGRLSIERFGGSRASASLPGRRAELVFAYLAAEHRRTVSRDELADALWPERLPDTWAAALRSVMSDVRRFLEDGGLNPGEVLITEPSGYRLQLPRDVVVDLDEARAQLAEAGERLSAGDVRQAAAIGRQAAELSALPFLPQHEGSWVDGIRDELRAIHGRALELQVHALADAQDWRAAARVAEQLVRAEPYSEPAHQLRISVLADGDDIAAAVKAFEHCKAVLRAELGLEPSADTQAVLRQALGRKGAQAPAAGRDDEAATGQAAAAAADAAASPFARLSVLVVEDHPFQRRTALALLRGLGVGTLAGAEDGHAALEWLARCPPPDVIICDIDMPGMDGVEFIRRVAQRGLASAIAIASGLDRRLLNTIKSVSESYGLQVLGAVEKPLTARRLNELLAAYRPPPRRGDGGAEMSATDLAGALAGGHVVAELQPIIDLAGGAVSAAQIVARWRQPAGPPIDQPQFEHLLEHEELTTAFVDRLVELLCDQLHELDAAGQAVDVWIAIPDAALADLTLADRLVEHARARGADPRRIVCAIGAHTLRRGTALHVLARLRVMGFGVCLDDFATTHTTLGQLERVPVTAVRLAQELICGAHSNPARIAILQEAIDVARGLGLSVVGGGCETGVDFELLLEVGCDYGQGTVIGGAMPAADLADWASSWTPPLTEEHR